MEVVERPSKSKEEPHLSGACIRSLVKHLSSSRPNDEAQPLQSPSPPPPPIHPPKKQVRRRLHTSRPYQEIRLLNMAEARKEIVTALKFHRANSMKVQAPPPSSPNPTPNIYQQNHPTFSNPSPTHFTYPSLPTPAPLLDINNPPIILPLSSPHSSSSSYSTPPVHGTKRTLHAQTMALGSTCDLINIDLGDQKLHLAMDEKEMAEIRSIGEKHDIEWNDTVNFVTWAWWSKFLETTEVEDSMERHGFQAFGGIPAWLKNGSGGDGDTSHLFMQHLDDYCLQDASLLPW